MLARAEDMVVEERGRCARCGCQPGVDASESAPQAITALAIAITCGPRSLVQPHRPDSSSHSSASHEGPFHECGTRHILIFQRSRFVYAYRRPEWYFSHCSLFYRNTSNYWYYCVQNCVRAGLQVQCMLYQLRVRIVQDCPKSCRYVKIRGSPCP